MKALIWWTCLILLQALSAGMAPIAVVAMMPARVSKHEATSGSSSEISGPNPHKDGATYDAAAYGLSSSASGSANTSALNAALAAVCATDGTLELPAGRFQVTPTSTSSFLVIEGGCNVHIRGAGTGTTVLQVSANAGDYDAIFSAPQLLGAVTFSDLTIDQNSANNPMTSTTHPRWAIVGGGTRLTVDRITIININAVNTIYSGFSNAIVSNSRFLNIGGGSFYHDYSGLYMTADNVTITGNLFQGNLNAAGAATAIETHGGRQTVTANTIDSMAYGMNITGIAREESRNIRVSDNVMSSVYVGIEIWSGTYGSHTSGYGIDGATVANNQIKVKQVEWTTSPTSGSPMIGNMAGITINPKASLPLRNVQILGNRIEFDLETPPSSPPVSLASVGIGYWDAYNQTSIMCDGCKFNGNTIRNAPVVGVHLAASYRDAEINDNYIINAASSGNSTLPCAYRTAIFVDPPSGGVASNLKIANNRISDTQTTSKLVKDIAVTTISLSLNTEVSGNITCVLDLTHSSYSSACDVGSTLGSPDSAQYHSEVSSPTSALAPSNTVKGGNCVLDVMTGRGYSLRGAH